MKVETKENLVEEIKKATLDFERNLDAARQELGTWEGVTRSQKASKLQVEQKIAGIEDKLMKLNRTLREVKSSTVNSQSNVRIAVPACVELMFDGDDMPEEVVLLEYAVDLPERTVVSVDSPLGASLIGLAVNERFSYAVKNMGNRIEGQVVSIS